MSDDGISIGGSGDTGGSSLSASPADSSGSANYNSSEQDMSSGQSSEPSLRLTTVGGMNKYLIAMFVALMAANFGFGVVKQSDTVCRAFGSWAPEWISSLYRDKVATQIDIHDLLCADTVALIALCLGLSYLSIRLLHDLRWSDTTFQLNTAWSYGLASIALPIIYYFGFGNTPHGSSSIAVTSAWLGLGLCVYCCFLSEFLVQIRAYFRRGRDVNWNN